MANSQVFGNRIVRNLRVKWLSILLILSLLAGSLPSSSVGAAVPLPSLKTLAPQLPVLASSSQLTRDTTASIPFQHDASDISPSLCPSIGDTSQRIFLPLVKAHSTGVLNVARAASSPLSFSVLTSVPTDTVASNFAASTAFLYTGEHPVQTGVRPASIAPACASVVRGRTLTRTGAPLSGITVTVLGHPEYGSTQTRGDGMFDLAVNGGGLLTVHYQKVGYLSAQRQVQAVWQDYVWLPDVALIPLDTKVTAINPTATSIQVARGTAVIDGTTTRQATLLFAPGTQVSMQSKQGRVLAFSAQTPLHVRATEYTVGNTGPVAMPGNLPGQSGYTYAVAYTVDEATAVGATSVQFSQPVVSYLENFLHFPVGSPVPAGYYNPDTAAWVPAKNGQVIKILAIANGMADVDSDGDNIADDAAKLQALGITAGERQQLAKLYSANATLWRVLVNHFTDWDFNWPFSPPKGATAPDQPKAANNQPVDKPHFGCGSIIECQNQNLGEAVPVAGTSFALHYQSDRVPGRIADNALDIPISGATVPISLKQVELQIQVAGQQVTQHLLPLPNQHYSFVWNGLDAYGRALQGRQPVSIRIGYTYDGVYLLPSDRPGGNYDQAFGHFSYYGAPATGDRTRQEVTIWQDQHAMVGHWDARPQGLGGWSLNVLHAYDPRGQVLYLGDGNRRSAQSIQPAMTTIAGNGSGGFSSDGGFATQAQLNGPRRVAVAADGSVFVADRYNSRIRRIGPNGIITTVAGTGTAGFSGDGGPATKAQINTPMDIAIGSDRSLFFADSSNYRIRRIGPNGIITTVAGTGVPGFSGDGGPATQAQLGGVDGIAVDMAGSIYIADTSNQRIRRIEPGGTITTVADGEAYGLTVGSDGSLYLAESYQQRVVRIAPDGTSTTIAGTGTQGSLGDGGPATEAELARPDNLAFAADGSLYVTEYTGHRIRRINPDGVITTVAGTGTPGFQGDGGPAPAAQLNGPSGVAVGPDGSLYIADHDQNRVRRVASPLAGFSASEIAIPSEDGSVLYQFTASGRHLRTLNALTGAVLYQFTYTAAGTLSQITDGDNNVTSIARDASGNPTAITGPYGQRTVLGLDGNGYLSSIADPAGETVRLTTAGTGLLTGFTNANGQASIITYDALGRLLSDRDAGGSTTLARTDFNTQQRGQLTWKRSTIWTGAQPGPQDTSGRFWSAPGFDDSAWTSVVLPDYGGDSAVDDRYYRAHFTWDGVTPVSLHFAADDGLAIMVNGSALGNGGPGWHQSGCVNQPGGCAISTTVPDQLIPDSLLHSGDNVIAVDLSNGSCCNYYLDMKVTIGSAGHRVTVTSALGRTDTHTVDTLPTGDQRQLSSFADGTRSAEQKGTNGSDRATLPQGDVIQTVEGPDPRFGMLAAIPASETSTTPSGLVMTVTTNRTATLADANNPLSLQSQTDTVNVNNRIYTSAYNATSRTFTDTSPQGRQQTYTIDAQGRVTANQVTGLAPSRMTYDTHGRLSTVSVGSGSEIRSISYTYTTSGYLDTITDPLGRTVHFAYDAVGRVTQQTLPDGNVVGYSYDANGNLTGLTPPSRPAHSFTYTPVDLLATATAPVVGAQNSRTQYTYNADRQLTQIARPDGRTVGLAYENTGQLHAVTIARGQITYGYNATTGQVSSITAPGGLALTYGYDGSLPTGLTWSGAVAGNVNYTYDNNFRLTSTTVNGGKVIAFQYDNDNLLTQAGSLILSHNAQNGLLTGSTLGTVNDTWGYNSFGEPVSYGATAGASGLYNVTYTRDKLGRIVQKVETIGGIATTYGYAYDKANRLAGVTRNGVTVEGYTYDSNGNRLSATLSGASANGRYDNQDRLTTYGGNTYAYTANGDLQSKTAGGQQIIYQYDELGNLTAATLPGGTQITYLIDGQSRRIGKRVNGVLRQRWLYDGQLRPTAELDAANVAVSRFIYASHANVPDYMIKGTATYRLITDQLGSPRLVVDTATGAIVQRMDYDSFGNVTQDTSPGFQPFGFAGGLYDRDTKLVRFGARDYDAQTGRWTAKDPIGFGGGDSNLYGYVGQNPVNWNDPGGEFIPAAAAAVGWCVAGGCEATAAAIGEAISIIRGGLALSNFLNTINPPDRTEDGPKSSEGSGEETEPGESGVCKPSTPARGMPTSGEPGTWAEHPYGKQWRQFDSNGQPAVDIDFIPHHGQSSPHAHNWGGAGREEGLPVSIIPKYRR